MPRVRFTKCSGMTPNQLYGFLNSRYFRGSLPKLRVYWLHDYKGTKPSRRRAPLGFTAFNGLTGKPKYIGLNPNIAFASRIWAATLLHEMVHVQKWKIPSEQAHGRKFIKRMKQLASIGAFNNLW